MISGGFTSPVYAPATFFLDSDGHGPWVTHQWSKLNTHRADHMCGMVDIDGREHVSRLDCL